MAHQDFHRVCSVRIFHNYNRIYDDTLDTYHYDCIYGGILHRFCFVLRHIRACSTFFVVDADAEFLTTNFYVYFSSYIFKRNKYEHLQYGLIFVFIRIRIHFFSSLFSPDSPHIHATRLFIQYPRVSTYDDGNTSW